jgi:hypothetical protein
MTLTFCGLLLGGIGAGRWSLDNALGIFDPPGWTGLVITVVAGFGGAASLLAVFWRPRPA